MKFIQQVTDKENVVWDDNVPVLARLKNDSEDKILWKEKEVLPESYVKIEIDRFNIDATNTPLGKNVDYLTIYETLDDGTQAELQLQSGKTQIIYPLDYGFSLNLTYTDGSGYESFTTQLNDYDKVYKYTNQTARTYVKGIDMSHYTPINKSPKVGMLSWLDNLEYLKLPNYTILSSYMFNKTTTKFFELPGSVQVIYDLPKITDTFIINKEADDALLEYIINYDDYSWSGYTGKRIEYTGLKSEFINKYGIKLRSIDNVVICTDGKLVLNNETGTYKVA